MTKADTQLIKRYQKLIAISRDIASTLNLDLLLDRIVHAAAVDVVHVGLGDRTPGEFDVVERRLDRRPEMMRLQPRVAIESSTLFLSSPMGIGACTLGTSSPSS